MTFALPPRVSRHLSREEGGDGHETAVHKSVLVHEVLAALDLKKMDIVVDATYGAGGHASKIKPRVKKLITIDADPSAKASIVGNFADIKDLVSGPVDKMLFDLGWRTEQLRSGRGFSFMEDEPLDMSYGSSPRSGFSAAEVLNTWDEKALADALYGYGEERYARRIAKGIVARRAMKPFETTYELVELVKDAVPAAYRRGRLHPATKTFQALRMAVNDELGAIGQGLTGAWHLLAPGGRLVVITFHSVEDRAVKRLFAGFVKDGGGRLVYKKPLAPTRAEVTKNPAARSAKLRAIEKA